MRPEANTETLNECRTEATDGQNGCSVLRYDVYKCVLLKKSVARDADTDTSVVGMTPTCAVYCEDKIEQT